MCEIDTCQNSLRNLKYLILYQALIEPYKTLSYLTEILLELGDMLLISLRLDEMQN